MFGIGFGEAVVIFVVALLVFGPEKMPVIAKAVGRAMGELKRALGDAQTEIANSVKDTQTTPPVNNPWTSLEKEIQAKPPVNNPWISSDSKTETASGPAPEGAASVAPDVAAPDGGEKK